MISITSMTRSILVWVLVVCVGAPFFSTTAGAQSSDGVRRTRSTDAARAMGSGRFDEAARLYREMLQAAPDEPGLLMNFGMALAMGGHEAEAIAPLARAVSLDAGLVAAHLFLGSSYLAIGEAAKAIRPLERAVAARPRDTEHRRMLAQAYVAAGRPADAVTHLRKITEIAPRLPGGWYALGHAYNALTQDALSTFEKEPDDSPWRLLLVADALLADGRFTDAFVNYRDALARLPSMMTIRDSIARIYEKTGHADWAAQERRLGAMPATECAKRRSLCDFRGGRYRASLAAALAASDVESRYWRARAATELALAAFKRLDSLPDSRERREMRAAVAREDRRFADAIGELEAALKFAPADPDLLDDLGTSYYLARDFDKAIATLLPLLEANPDDPRLLTVSAEALMQLQRLEEALPMLERAVELAPADAMPRLALGRAFVQKGNFADAIPLIEPQLPGDRDGSLHVQLARAYTGLGQGERAAALLARSQEIQRAEQERSAATARRTITPPK